MITVPVKPIRGNKKASAEPFKILVVVDPDLETKGRYQARLIDPDQAVQHHHLPTSGQNPCPLITLVEDTLFLTAFGVDDHSPLAADLLVVDILKFYDEKV